MVTDFLKISCVNNCKIGHEYNFLSLMIDSS